jgi:uncharacterized membrane protein YgdD (TMEM256/DUF423 family)
MAKIWLIAGAGFAFLGVAMGAFGAHALSASFTERQAQVYETAARYQLYHALALLALGLWVGQSPANATSLAQWAGWAFVAGIVVFSGSLYALAITDIKVLGAITPIGGLAFLAGWLLFALSAARSA